MNRDLCLSGELVNDDLTMAPLVVLLEAQDCYNPMISQFAKLGQRRGLVIASEKLAIDRAPFLQPPGPERLPVLLRVPQGPKMEVVDVRFSQR